MFGHFDEQEVVVQYRDLLHYFERFKRKHERAILLQSYLDKNGLDIRVVLGIIKAGGQKAMYEEISELRNELKFMECQLDEHEELSEKIEDMEVQLKDFGNLTTVLKVKDQKILELEEANRRMKAELELSKQTALELEQAKEQIKDLPTIKAALTQANNAKKSENEMAQRCRSTVMYMKG